MRLAHLGKWAVLMGSGTAALGDADHDLHRALLKVLLLKNHSTWPHARREPTSQIRDAVNRMLQQWRSIPDAVTGSSLGDEQQCAVRSDHIKVIRWLLVHQTGLHHLANRLKLQL